SCLDQLKGDLPADGLRLVGYPNRPHPSFANSFQQLVAPGDNRAMIVVALHVGLRFVNIRSWRASSSDWQVGELPELGVGGEGRIQLRGNVSVFRQEPLAVGSLSPLHGLQICGNRLIHPVVTR